MQRVAAKLQTLAGGGKKENDGNPSRTFLLEFNKCLTKTNLTKEIYFFIHLKTVADIKEVFEN